MRNIIVKEKDDGKKLTTFITSEFPKLKISSLHKALRKKDIKINDKRISKDEIIHLGDSISIYLSDDLLMGEIKNIDIDVIYEDDNILAVNKKEGIEVTGINSLTEALQGKHNFIEPCHRIDRNTTGLVLFAKNLETLNYIKQKFKTSDIEKHYLAFCYGIPKVNSKKMTAYLFKDRKKSLVYISDDYKKGYVKILTSYTVLEKDTKNNTSILDVELHTGRTHQIRAHLAHEGLPIIGDGKYGSYEINRKFKRKTQVLCSYSILFKNFEGKWEYLNNITLKLPSLKMK